MLGKKPRKVTRMGGQPMISYHDCREISPRKARELTRKVLGRSNGNVSRTAKILGISRPTVRRARDGGCDDQSRRPHHSPRKTPDEFEALMVVEAKRTGFRYRRLSSYLHRKYALVFSEDTVKAILRRKKVTRRTRRAAAGKRRHLTIMRRWCPLESCSWIPSTC